MRYAIYFSPPPQTVLGSRAASWLGRDIHSGASSDPAGAQADTVAPRRYGFHATLKAPFQLAPSESLASLVSALENYCTRTPPIVVPEMEIGMLGDFFAIVPKMPSADLNAFAAEIVSHFDGFRAPMTDADFARRSPAKLRPNELRNLKRWGYPYVMDAFHFHMTLSSRVPTERQPELRAALRSHFDGAVPSPFPIDTLVLAIEPEPNAEFTVHSMHLLGRNCKRESA